MPGFPPPESHYPPQHIPVPIAQSARRPVKRPGVWWWLGAVFAPHIVVLLPYTWRVVRMGWHRFALLTWTAVLIIGALAQPGSDPDATRTVHVDAAAAPRASSAAAEATHEPTPSPTSKIVLGVAGKPVRYDNIEFTVTGILKRKTLTRGAAPASRYLVRRPRLPRGGGVHLPNVGCPGNCIPNPNLPNHLPTGATQSADGNTLTAAGTYLIVYMSVRNLDDHTNLNSLRTKLVDTTGHEHEPDAYAELLLGSDSSFGYLKAKELKKLAIVFDIPEKAGPRRLELHNYDTEGVTITWPSPAPRRSA